jgi:PIN domain nuclease of toxin-antitoxin system
VTAPLLDTHAWVWWVLGDFKALGRSVGEALDALAADARPAISDISLWEVATLVSRGRLELDVPLAEWFRDAASPQTVQILPITAEIATEVAELPAAFTRDPADRIIVATSRVLDRPLVTRDGPILRSRLTRRWKPE